MTAICAGRTAGASSGHSNIAPTTAASRIKDPTKASRRSLLARPVAPESLSITQFDRFPNSSIDTPPRSNRQQGERIVA